MKDLAIKITAAVVDNDQILLIKEKNDQNNQYYWNLIKGTFEPEKDKNIFDTVIRECKEEANINVKIEKIINIIFYRQKDKIRLQINFICSSQGAKPRISSQTDQSGRNEDIIELKFFTKTELSTMDKNQFMDERTYIIIKELLAGNSHDLSILKDVVKL